MVEDMKKRILLLTTGGTIAASEGEEGLEPSINSSRLYESVSSVSDYYDVDKKDLMCLDSSNIQPEEWQQIARSISESCGDYDGIVITHGTDTMAYTSSALSYMLRNIGIPVVLTGSQLPITHPLTDAKENLHCAFSMAAGGVPGVFVAFNRKVMLGTRTVKIRTMGIDAFESVNYPNVAKVGARGLEIDRSTVPAVTGGFVLKDRLDPNVFLLKLIPGLNPGIFKLLSSMRFRGIVIEAFGAGGLHFIRRNLISELRAVVDEGIAVVVSSQCLYEGSDFSIYQAGRKALAGGGILQSYDMTTEAAVTKLMWCLGQTETGEDMDISELFLTSVAGELGANWQKEHLYPQGINLR